MIVLFLQDRFPSYESFARQFRSALRDNNPSEVAKTIKRVVSEDWLTRAVTIVEAMPYSCQSAALKAVRAISERLRKLIASPMHLRQQIERTFSAALSRRCRTELLVVAEAIDNIRSDALRVSLTGSF